MRAYRQAKTIDWIEQRFNAAPSPEIEEEVLRARALVTSSIFVAVLLLGWQLAGSLGSTGTLADPATAVATTAITATFVVLRISSSVYWPGIWFGCWTIVAFGAQLLLNVDASFALVAPLILAPAIFGLVVSARAGSLSTACVCAMFLAAALINLGSGSPDATQNILLGAICTAFCGGLVSYFSSYREQETRKLIILSEGFRNAAYRDSLTNAFNRRAYNERMLSLQRRMHQSGRPSLLVIDVDKFKSINDTYGHAVGDKVLKFIVQRTENVLEDGQTLYRIGGDEFAILFEDEADFEVLGDVAANIVAAVKQGEQKSRGRPDIDLSIGMAMSDGSAASIARLYTQADAAAFAAKESTGSKVVTYDAKLKSAILRKTNVEIRLRTALTRGDINIAFQPQFRLKGAEMIGFEALARWSDPKLGIVGPDEFVGVAEESALIHDFDRMIARKSLKSAALWLAKNQTISINVSGHTVVSADYCRFLIQEIANSGLSPQQVEIEITETALIENWETCRRNIDRMRKEGIRIVLDDFGIGYSSLSYLSQFPVQKIKFDRTFLLQCRSASNTKVMHTIVQLAKVLDVEVIAEGVETNRHVALLKHIGCPYAQGYLFAKPIAATKMHEFFRSRAVKTLLDASDTGTFEPIENMVA